MNALEIDAVRRTVNATLDPQKKVNLGQYMTPSAIADFMAGLFEKSNKAKLLDCGAGIGSLTLAAAKRLESISKIDLWELDPIMANQLDKNLIRLGAPYELHQRDFIFDAVERIRSNSGERYTHAILNPPYKKISSDSEHREALREVGIETVNLYSAFLALTIKLMNKGGEVVAIVPRSFCNGTYYKPFREMLLNECSIEHIHVFNSRNKAFQEDDVLQENIIIKLVRGKRQGQVNITQSTDHQFNDHQTRTVDFSDVVKPTDLQAFIHIPLEKQEENHALFAVSLPQLGLGVSTGQVVDFRMKEFLEQEPTEGAVPLLYPHHFVNGEFQYPKKHKKPNAIKVAADSQKWLMPNDGFYVIVKRFSAKEERRRVVAYIVNPEEIGHTWLGFENHWNVFHVKKHGLERTIALGLACFLNSTILDNHFRVFSGHTQVNATDLKNMKYPTPQFLNTLGKEYHPRMRQEEVDFLVERVND